MNYEKFKGTEKAMITPDNYKDKKKINFTGKVESRGIRYAADIEGKKVEFFDPDYPFKSYGINNQLVYQSKTNEVKPDEYSFAAYLNAQGKESERGEKTREMIKWLNNQIMDWVVNNADKISPLDVSKDDMNDKDFVRKMLLKKFKPCFRPSEGKSEKDDPITCYMNCVQWKDKKTNKIVEPHVEVYNDKKQQIPWTDIKGVRGTAYLRYTFDGMYINNTWISPAFTVQKIIKFIPTGTSSESEEEKAFWEREEKKELNELGSKVEETKISPTRQEN